MAKPKPLHISIHNPCSEQWDSMKEVADGKFCNACQKTVVDFSYLSDSELFTYFKGLKTIPCGRFHNSQLDKPLYSAKCKKNLWLRMYRPVAALLSFLMLRNSGAATITKEKVINVSIPIKQINPNQPKEKNIINGIVKDNEGKPLENAKIILERTVIVNTDKDGSFSIEVPESLGTKNLLLEVGYSGLVSVVRSYHPAMKSTSYEIVLYPPIEYATCYFMGIPVINEKNFPSTFISFKKNDNSLSKDAESALSKLAEKIKSNPGVSFKIIARNNKLENTTNKKIQIAVRNYFINEYGFSEERFIIATEAEPNINPYTIKIKATEGEY